MDRALAPGVTKAGEGVDNISWNILGQIYVPKQVSRKFFRLARDFSARHVRAAAHSSDARRVHLYVRGTSRTDD